MRDSTITLFHKRLHAYKKCKIMASYMIVTSENIYRTASSKRPGALSVKLAILNGERLLETGGA